MEYRRENGGELAADDDANLAEVATIDAFDEVDHEGGEEIADAATTLRKRVAACGPSTSQATLGDLSEAPDDLEGKLSQRGRRLGLRPDRD